jgi:hypothetical protein
MIATGMALVLAAAPSHAALVETFMFSDGSGNSVTGEINGLTVGGNGQAASGIIVQSFTGPSFVNIDFTTPLSLNPVEFNSFSVDAFGNVNANSASVDALANTATSLLELVFAGGTGTFACDEGCTGNFSGAVTFSPAPTPLPGGLPLFAGGLGLIGFLARRRKQAAAK